MIPKVDPSKFPEMLNAITENVRDSYAGMVFIDDPEDLDSWGFTKEQLDELDSFAQKYGLTDVLEINEWNPDSKPDYILSAFSGLVDKIDDLQGRIRPKADDVSIENFIYLNQIKADVPEPNQLAHAEENDHIFGLISKFAEGQDTAFVVQKVNFSGTKQIGEPEYELLPLGPTSGEDLADFTEWFMDDFKSGVDFGCDENREHLAMLAHTGFYREGEYVDQLLTFHQLDFSNAHAVTEKFSLRAVRKAMSSWAISTNCSMIQIQSSARQTSSTLSKTDRSKVSPTAGRPAVNTRDFPIKPKPSNLPAAKSLRLNNVNRESSSRPRSRQNDQRT